MAKTFDKPITIEKIDEATEKWTPVFSLHAAINKSRADNEYLNTGAIHAKRNLVFEVRYFAGLEDISFNIQKYRIVYKGVPFNIEDYDDFNLRHKTVKLAGVSY